MEPVENHMKMEAVLVKTQSLIHSHHKTKTKTDVLSHTVM